MLVGTRCNHINVWISIEQNDQKKLEQLSTTCTFVIRLMFQTSCLLDATISYPCQGSVWCTKRIRIISFAKRSSRWVKSRGGPRWRCSSFQDNAHQDDRGLRSSDTTIAFKSFTTDSSLNSQSKYKCISDLQKKKSHQQDCKTFSWANE